MVLANPEEVYDFEIQVVENFHFRGLLVEEHLGATGEGFDVGRVLREESDDFFG